MVYFFCAAIIRRSQRLMQKDTAMPITARITIIRQVFTNELVASYNAPAIVDPNEAMIRLVLMIEKFIG